MKKIITESELINRARGLREYLNVLEAKFDQNVKDLQNKLIQAGATIKADGFMGPATQAAMKQFPNVTTQTDAQQAVGADINSADKAPEIPAQAPTSAQAERDDAAAVDKANPPAAPAPAPAAPAVDPAVIADVKQIANTPLNSIPRFGIAIDPKSGQIFYGDAGDDTGTIRPKGYPYKWMQPGGPAESIKDGNRIKASGLEIIDKGGYAYIDPAKLATLGQAPAAAPADIDIGFGPGKFQPDAAPAPAAPVATESVGYGDEQILARIVELSRR